MTGDPRMRALMDIESPLELLLESLGQGVDLWLSVGAMALDRVRDEDLPQLVDAVVKHRPAVGADDLGQLLLLQAPHLMEPHSDRLRNRPYLWEEEGLDNDLPPVLLPAHHLIFREGHLRRHRFDDWAALRHDGGTWRPAGPAVGEVRVGGAAEGRCFTCHAPLHRVLDLGTFPSPVGLDLPRELVTCASFACLWGEQFFSHDTEMPVPLTHRDHPGDDGIPVPELMPVMPVTFHAAPPRWRLQDISACNCTQNLNRVGGPGSWVQDAAFPRCPRCEHEMPLLAQLDGMTPFDEIVGWERWTEGLVYVYWCDDCRVSATSSQQT